MQPSDRGKSKALRIRLDYYRQASWFDRARYLAIALCGVVAGMYGGWVCLSMSSDSLGMRRTHLSTGPLAQVHATFENNCEKCHGHGLEVSLGQDSWQTNPTRRLNHQESACQSCHRVDGHWRSALVDPAQDRDCANCHREHEGRLSQLAKVPNATCTSCHGDLQKVCSAAASESIANTLRVKQFSADSHGVLVANSSELQFRSLLKDTGRVKFDHAQHLQPGQIDRGQRGGMRLKMLPENSRNVYRQVDQTDDDLVQLNCESCHQLHALNKQSQHVSAASEGRYYAPINFDQHCAACHQLTFPGQTDQMLPLPHVATRIEYEMLLLAKRQAVDVQSRAEVCIEQVTGGAGDVQADESLVGESPVDQSPVDQSLLPSDLAVSVASTASALDGLMQRCLQCHQPSDTTHQAITAALAGNLQPLIPSRWLVNGYFDHAAHQRIENCAFCHEIPGSVSGRAYTIGPPTDQHNVYIRGPESCVTCHRHAEAPEPLHLANTQRIQQMLGRADQPTWASDDCTQCHRYHWTRPSADLLDKAEVLP